MSTSSIVLVQVSLGLKAYTDITPHILHVAASGTPGNYLLPPIISSFQQTHPGIIVNLSLGTSSQVVDAVRAHQAEIGIVGGHYLC